MSDRIGTVRAVSFSPTGSTRRVLRSIAAGIGAARVQDISLNPQKLAGQCSKLKCCTITQTAR